MFLTAFLGNALGPCLPVSSCSLTISTSKQYFCAESLSGTGGAVGLKTTTVSAHLNFTAENPTYIFKENYFKENLPAGLEIPPSFSCCPCTHSLSHGKMRCCLSALQWSWSWLSAVSLSPACLALSLLEIYSRNRKCETHLNS